MRPLAATFLEDGSRCVVLGVDGTDFLVVDADEPHPYLLYGTEESVVIAGFLETDPDAIRRWIEDGLIESDD